MKQINPKLLKKYSERLYLAATDFLKIHSDLMINTTEGMVLSYCLMAISGEMDNAPTKQEVEHMTRKT